MLGLLLKLTFYNSKAVSRESRHSWSLIKVVLRGPCVVVHACNPSYLEGSNRRTDLRPPLLGWEAEKKSVKPSLKSKVGMVVHTCNSKYLGGKGRKIMIQGQPEQKYKKN
jgi:hypothetical protein